jgi:periplasmic protein TonB
VLPGNDQNSELLIQVKIMNTSSMSVDVYETHELAEFIKKILAICFGIIMTMSLFYMMYLLIRNDSLPEEPVKTPPIPQVNYIEKTITNIFENEVPPPVKPVIHHTPPAPYEPITPNVEPGLTIPFEPVIVEPPKVPGFSMNAQSLPIVKFAPVYPHAAITKGIEGFVDVVFDVTETGATENIQIVYAEPAKIFNSAVLKAVARWKYKPKSDDVGNPVKMFGVRERLRFTMEK